MQTAPKNRHERRAGKKQHANGSAPKLVEARPRASLRLDLGCGQTPKEGFEGVDVASAEAKHRVDLFKFPFPFADGSVEELHASHLCEHIPAREVEARDIHETMVDGYAVTIETVKRFLGQDFFFAFMDECWRIMAPDAWMTIVVPSGKSSRAWWDPTHRRFFQQQTFLYLSEEWRIIQGLDHYNVHTHFAVDVGHTWAPDEALRSEEAQRYRLTHLWDVTQDYVAKLKKLPRMTPEQVAATKENRKKMMAQAGAR
jgi:predicted SAM-dependent methyltransferase